MHLVLLDRWNSLESPLHRLDPRSKIAALVGLVLFLVISARGLALKVPALGVFLIVLIMLSRVPLGYCVKRACLVLPFSLVAVAGALLGHLLPGADPATGLSVRAAAEIVGKSYLSALSILLLVATTRLSDLLKAMEYLRVPGLLLMIVQFLYRYLFVLSEEAQHMSYARRSRGGARAPGLRAAGAAVAVLFARSYARADRIHRAMLARGFTGVLPTRRRFRWAARDFAFVTLSAVYLTAVQIAVVRLG